MGRAIMRVSRRRALGLLAGLILSPVIGLRPTGRAAWSAPPTDATAVVQDLAAQVWALIGRPDLTDQQRIDALAEVLASKTDVALLSRLVLGRHWQRLDDQQRVSYEELFRDVVPRSFASRLNQYTRDAGGQLEERFTITSSAPAGKQDVLVRSTVRPQSGEPLAVDWRLREGDGGPVIIDVIISGVSLLVSQRSEFAAVIERSDMEGLLAALRARAESSRS